jgi:hypothetical protein
MISKGHDVFLSYSSKDEEWVKPLLQGLRRLGYLVFFAPDSVPLTEDFRKTLLRSIRVSRKMVLCWSKSASQSEVVKVEYIAALHAGKEVVLWFLDDTPPPVMLQNSQGIVNDGVSQAVARLRPVLSWNLARRWMAAAVVDLLLAAALAVSAWHMLNPPPTPPWEFQGQVTDLQTLLPIPGVKVTLKLDDGIEHSTQTDSRGMYTLKNLPQPRPAYIKLKFAKDGYLGDSPKVESTMTDFDPKLQRIP